jgi:Glycosyl hydrolase family 79 C-terminal beta domain
MKGGSLTMLTRRALLRSTLGLTAGAVADLRLRGLAQAGKQASLRLSPGALAPLVPENFIGFGYEMSSAAQLGLLSAQNTKYVQLVGNLSSHGVFRFGGIVADSSNYEPEGPVHTDPRNTVVSRARLMQLRGFLDATGWTAIWSLNFGRGTLQQAIVEARAVHSILGPRLDAIELGNEVENYGRGDHPLRTTPWGFNQYLAEYREWHQAIVAAIPGLRFAGPDTAASVQWVQEVAEEARGDVQLLTTHFYLGDQRNATLSQLTQPDPRLKSKLERLRQISRDAGIPWRMCETNSFFGGGRPGLSDSFAGALWTLDYLLLLAASGCAGVNLETGVNQLGFLSSYSPIRTDADGQVWAGAPYYGMLAFAAARVEGAELLPVENTGSVSELTAYAVRKQGLVRTVVVLNWSQSNQVSVSIAGLGLRSPQVLRLTAPGLTSKEGVHFGGEAVDAEGRWSSKEDERLQSESIALPPASAVVVRESNDQT